MLMTSPGVKVRLLGQSPMFAPRDGLNFVCLKKKPGNFKKLHFTIRLMRVYPKFLPGLLQRKILEQS